MNPAVAALVMHYCRHDQQIDDEPGDHRPADRLRRPKARPKSRTSPGRGKEEETGERRLEQCRRCKQHEAFVPFGPAQVDDGRRDQTGKEQYRCHRDDREGPGGIPISGIQPRLQTLDRYCHSGEQHGGCQRNSSQAPRAMALQLPVRDEQRLRQEEQRP
jgi:hypothetical protein